MKYKVIKLTPVKEPGYKHVVFMQGKEYTRQLVMELHDELEAQDWVESLIADEPDPEVIIYYVPN